MMGHIRDAWDRLVDWLERPFGGIEISTALVMSYVASRR